MIIEIFKDMLNFSRAIFEPCHCGYCEPKTDADFMAYLFQMHIADCQQLLEGAERGSIRHLQELANHCGTDVAHALITCRAMCERARASRDPD